MKQVFKNQSTLKYKFKEIIEYSITALVFYGIFVFLELLPIHIIIPILICGYLAFIFFLQKSLILFFVIILFTIHLFYLGFQRLILTNKIRVKPNLLELKPVISKTPFELQIIDLDGSITQQTNLIKSYKHKIICKQKWGKKIRTSCSFSTFRKFEIELAKSLNKQQHETHYITLLGSNDFDHVTLALLRHISTPFNLLFFDQHADWNPFFLTHMMCGSWLYHAFNATNMVRVFHVGGSEKAFDATGNLFDAVECFGNARGIQKHIDDGRVVCLPATRSFAQNPYINYECTINQPVKNNLQLSQEHLLSLLDKYQGDLSQFPLFIAIDKDVLNAQNNIQAWGTGELSIEDVEIIISTFMQLCNHKIAGVSICGDYSQSKYSSPLHRGNLIEKITFFHGIRNKLSTSSLKRNEKTNEKLVSLFLS